MSRDAKRSRVSAGLSSLVLLATARLSFSLRVGTRVHTSNSMLDASQVETSAITTSRDVGGGIRQEQNKKHAFLDLSSPPCLLSSSRLSTLSSSSAFSSSAASSSPSSSSPSSSSSFSSKWNLSLITSTRQLDAWSDLVAASWARKALFSEEDGAKPVRVFVSHARWMTRTSVPSTLQPDGQSFSIDNCSVPCVVEFNKDENLPLDYASSAPPDWTAWTTSRRVRAADVVMQVDRPWDAKQLQHFRASYPLKRAVFASWEPLGTAYRTASALSDRRYDWLASFTFRGENAADVPSTYEGLDHSDAAVAAFYNKRREREEAESADVEISLPSSFQGRAKGGSVVTRVVGRKQTGAAAVSSAHLARSTIKSRIDRNDDADGSNINEGNKASSSFSSSFSYPSFCRGAKSPVFMAVSNCAAGQRQSLLSAFMEVLPADSYGNCLRNSELGSDLLPGCAALQGKKDWREQKECMMSCYPFVLSIESTHSELDYATEKLFDPLMHDSVIPIYLGPPNEREFLPHRSAAVLIRDFAAKKSDSDTAADVVVDEETMRRVARYVASVSRNASAMQQLRSWRTELLNGMRDRDADDRGGKRRKKSKDDFPFQLRSWFSHRRFFCNLCTRYAAERVGVVGYDIVGAR